MREILFRGKRPNGEWAYGWYYPLRHDKDTITHYIVENPLPVLCGVKESVVDPSTIGQFTGLTDKNGKKIFEGDIVGFEDGMSTESGYAESGCTGCVYWNKETASFQVDNRLSAESYEVLEECAIIGNIYDNPELLEAES